MLQKSATRIRGFNSATAVKPWRLRRACAGSRSLGPLQFGHGGEAVETVASPQRYCKAKPLQFGHGGEAVETPEG